MPIEPEKPDLNFPRQEPAASPNPPPNPGAPVSTEEKAEPASALSPEEQMALFEKQLKEEDWGHQPC